MRVVSRRPPDPLGWLPIVLWFAAGAAILAVLVYGFSAALGSTFL